MSSVRSLLLEIISKKDAAMCFTLETLLFALGVAVLSADATFVNKLEGVIELPTITDNECRFGRWPRGSYFNRKLQGLVMKCCWATNEEAEPEAYNFRLTELVQNENLRLEYVGSQTRCDKLRNGTYRCRPSIRPEGRCYALVHLAFHVRRNSHVITKFTQADPDVMIERNETHHGSLTEYVFSHGEFFEEPFSYFEIQCANNEACLRDDPTVISLQYRF